MIFIGPMQAFDCVEPYERDDQPEQSGIRPAAGAGLPVQNGREPLEIRRISSGAIGSRYRAPAGRLSTMPAP